MYKKLFLLLILSIFLSNPILGCNKIFGKVSHSRTVSIDKPRTEDYGPIPGVQVLLVNEKCLDNIALIYQPGGPMMIKNHHGVYVTQTNKSGNYRLINIPSGRYEMYVLQVGFTGIKTYLDIQCGKSIKKNFWIKVHGLQDYAHITDNPSPIDVLDHTVSRCFSRSFIKHLPK